MKITEDRRKVILPETAERAVAVIDTELVRRFSTLPQLGRVYVDPARNEQVVPLNRRGLQGCPIPAA